MPVNEVNGNNVNGNSNREQGTVKWFDDGKGYGFIQLEGNREAFVHQTKINMRGRRSLTEGQTVECEVINSPKGLKAENVTVL